MLSRPSPFLWGQGEERQSPGSCYRRREGYFHIGKCLSDRHRLSKNSRAESLMALGVIANVRGRGVLQFAQVAERDRDADGEELEARQGGKDAAKGWGNR